MLFINLIKIHTSDTVCVNIKPFTLFNKIKSMQLPLNLNNMFNNNGLSLRTTLPK